MHFTDYDGILMISMAAPASSPTQNIIPIKEIRDGVVVLKDGTLRGLVLVSATNLALKSSEEQDAVMTAFQGFINTLEFSVQVVIQSRRFDVLPYIATLEDRLRVIPEELLRIQTRMYIEYIKAISDNSNIMQKHFYVAVPYEGGASPVASEKGLFGLFGGKKSKQQSAEEQSFEYKRAQLEQRMNVIRQGLGSMGLRVSDLDTQQMIQVFYQLYNPGDTGKSFTYLLGEQSDRE